MNSLLTPKPVVFSTAKNRTFVSGCAWHPLANTQGTARKQEIIALAKEQSFDLCVIRTTGAQQVGLASIDDGLRAGVMSVAALISKAGELMNWGRSFVCVVELPNSRGQRWLYVAQTQGVILANGDLCGAEDVIKTRCMGDISYGAFDTVIAPAHWGIQNSKELTFEDLVPKKGGKPIYMKWWELKPVQISARQRFVRFLPLIGIAMFSLVVLFFYGKYKQYKESQEVARVQIENEALRADETKRQMAHPWRNRPVARDFVRECVKSVGQIQSLWVGNWALRELTCSEGSTVVTWNRGVGGLVAHLLEVVPHANVLNNGNSASFGVTWGSIAGQDEKVLSLSGWNAEIILVSQNYGLNISVTPPVQPPVLPGDGNNQSAAKPDWMEVTVNVPTTNLPIVEVVDLIDEPGFRINKIKMTFAKGLIGWDIEGTQYVQN